MAATAELTLAEVADKCTDATLATYIDSMDALPAGVSTSEFVAKFCQAAYVAQVEKNAANTTAAEGELLAAWSTPITGTVETDPELNVQTYTAAYTVNIVASANLDTSVAAYV